MVSDSISASRAAINDESRVGENSFFQVYQGSVSRYAGVNLNYLQRIKEGGSWLYNIHGVCSE